MGRLYIEETLRKKLPAKCLRVLDSWFLRYNVVMVISDGNYAAIEAREIHIRPDLNDPVLLYFTMVHEVQHMVQHYEGRLNWADTFDFSFKRLNVLMEEEIAKPNSEFRFFRPFRRLFRRTTFHYWEGKCFISVDRRSTLSSFDYSTLPWEREANEVAAIKTLEIFKKRKPKPRNSQERGMMALYEYFVEGKDEHLRARS